MHNIYLHFRQLQFMTELETPFDRILCKRFTHVNASTYVGKDVFNEPELPPFCSSNVMLMSSKTVFRLYNQYFQNKNEMITASHVQMGIWARDLDIEISDGKYVQLLKFIYI